MSAHYITTAQRSACIDAWEIRTLRRSPTEPKAYRITVVPKEPTQAELDAQQVKDRVELEAYVRTFVEFTIHIRTTTESNTGGESRWSKSARAKKQKQAAWLPCYALDRVTWVGPKPETARNRNIRGSLAPFVSVTVPVVVTLTRVASRALDDDNLSSSMKHIRDGIADAIDVDDRDHRITWKVAQERGLPQQYDVRVRIEPTPEAEWKSAPVKRARKKRTA